MELTASPSPVIIRRRRCGPPAARRLPRQHAHRRPAGLAGLSRSLGVLGAVAGSLKTNEASTTLIMIDNRSGVQLAAAEGSAKNTDFNVFGAAFGWAGGAGAGGYSNTPEGKIIIAAFADSYNQLVQAVRNYKAQTVRGGLGTGGRLGVQGGSTAASKEVDAAAKPAPAQTPRKRA